MIDFCTQCKYFLKGVEFRREVVKDICIIQFKQRHYASFEYMKEVIRKNSKIFNVDDDLFSIFDPQTNLTKGCQFYLERSVIID